MHPSYFYGRGKENRAQIAVLREEVDSDEDNEVEVILDESKGSSKSETDTEPEETGRDTRQFTVRSVCIFV